LALQLVVGSPSAVLWAGQSASSNKSTATTPCA
jgi:hypothetical protein